MRFVSLTSSLFALTLVGLAAGVVAWSAGNDRAADVLWAITTIAGAIPIAASIVTMLFRRQAGVDVIALAAMIGSVALGEYLAGAVIALMVATGRALEDYASGRAERELSSLLKRAPRVAQRVDGDAIAIVPVADVQPGDVLLVREADVIPVDGAVVQDVAILDESALTGESRLVERGIGEPVQSGGVNAGGMFQMRASATADHSTYEGIIRLVRSAQSSKAPLVRLADRYAAFFIPLTAAAAGFAWAISGDPVRGLSVLVVATPCPLLLAAPIAIVGGISRAAGRGIVVKGGGALEVLARAEVVFLDKTGTLTVGAPRLERIAPFDMGMVSESEMLRLAASLDQVSSHTMAQTLIRTARERGLSLTIPDQVRETPGAGITGLVDGREVRVGSFDLVVSERDRNDEVLRFRRRIQRDDGAAIFVSVAGAFAGAFLVDDHIRPEAPRAVRSLKRAGIRDVVMVSGDHRNVAESVGAALGMDRVIPECTPEEKVEAVRASRSIAVTVMVGDGINDAPALAAADVGIAMGARGATSSSETADVVIMVDRLDRMVEALLIARRSRRIAVESMLLGMGLSLIAMGFAAFGYLTPVLGAFLQEGIDAVSIANALRALRGGRQERRQPMLPPGMLEELRAEHRRLSPLVEELRTVADNLDRLAPKQAYKDIERARSFVLESVLPHELSDESRVYPQIVDGVGGDDPLAAMSRTHREIFTLGRRLESIGDEAGKELDADDIAEARRLLYGLHVIIQLNIAQEEELYGLLDDGGPK